MGVVWPWLWWFGVLGLSVFRVKARVLDSRFEVEGPGLVNYSKARRPINFRSSRDNVCLS